MQRRCWRDLWVERKTPPRGKAFYRSTSNWEEIALKFILKKISKTFYLLLPCPYSVGHHALICKRRSSLDKSQIAYSRALCSRCNVKPLKLNRYHFTLDRLLDDRTLWYGCINLKQVNKGFTVCIKLRKVVTTSDLITAVNFANCLLFRQVWLLSVSETVRIHGGVPSWNTCTLASLKERMHPIKRRTHCCLPVGRDVGGYNVFGHVVVKHFLSIVVARHTATITQL